MIIQHKRQDVLKNYPVFPQRSYNQELDTEDCFYPAHCRNHILTSDSDSCISHRSNIGLAFVQLAGVFKATSLLFLGDMDTPWMYRSPEDDQSKQAYDFLASCRLSKEFNGGLEVPTAWLPNFVSHLACLINTNTLLPTIYCTDKMQQFLCSLCQYGNLHISTINHATEDLLVAFLKDNTHVHTTTFCK